MQTNGGAEEATTYTYDDLDRLATVTYAPDAGHPNGRTVTYGHDGAGNRKSEVVTDPQTQAVLESKTGHFDNANRLTELTDNLDPAQTTTLRLGQEREPPLRDEGGRHHQLPLRPAGHARGGRARRAAARALPGRLRRAAGPEDRRSDAAGREWCPGVPLQRQPTGGGSRGGQPTARYEWTNEELVSLLQSGGTRRYFALDGLETVLALTDEQGQPTDRLSLDAWGVPKEGTDFGTSGNRFVFTSHRFDTEINLYYAGGRMYSPTIGRFISQDTLSLNPNNPDTWNLFSYARGNPTTFIDPTGHYSLREFGQDVKWGLDFGVAFSGEFSVRTGETAANIATLGGYGGVKRAYAEGRVTSTDSFSGVKAYAEGVFNTITLGGGERAFGAYGEGKGAGGVALEAVKGVGDTVLPINEVKTLVDPSKNAWEKAEAIATGTTKVALLAAGGVAAKGALAQRAAGRAGVVTETTAAGADASLAPAEGALPPARPLPSVGGSSQAAAAETSEASGAAASRSAGPNLAKYHDIDYVEAVAARAGRFAVNRAQASGLTGRAAGAQAEATFENYAYQLQQRLMAAESPYRMTLQPASALGTGARVIARTQTSFVGRWTAGAKRLDYGFYSRFQGQANTAPVLSGGDFTVTRGGAFGVPAEYAPAFPGARIYGIDPRNIVVGPNP